MIHRRRSLEGEVGWWLCYDIFYKKSFWDRLRRPRILVEDFEYRAEECPYVEDVLSSGEGWEYLCSGDTLHTEHVLSLMGLRDEKDLEGLKRFLEERFKGIEIRFQG